MTKKHEFDSEVYWLNLEYNDFFLEIVPKSVREIYQQLGNDVPTILKEYLLLPAIFPNIVEAKIILMKSHLGKPHFCDSFATRLSRTDRLLLSEKKYSAAMQKVIQKYIADWQIALDLWKQRIDKDVISIQVLNIEFVKKYFQLSHSAANSMYQGGNVGDFIESFPAPFLLMHVNEPSIFEYIKLMLTS